VTAGLLLLPGISSGDAPLASAHPVTGVELDREPCAETDPLRRAFFGDLHVHTGFSLDASTMGTRTRPRDAYRFAQGEEIGIQPFDSKGQPMRRIRLERPLDFAAVTDHAELLGETHICTTPGTPGHSSIVCRIYRSFPRLAFFWMNSQASRAVRHDFCGDGAIHCLTAARIPWQETLEAAESAYDRSSACRFTTFNAYEWTGAAGMGNNFHRNVIFATDVVPQLPISFIDTPVLMDLWSRLGSECRDAGTGCDVLVIPHNSNLSAGLMFRTELPDGTPIGAEEAAARASYERLVEVMQHKGESECMLGVGTEDELCSFENLEMNSFGGRFVPFLAEPPVPRQFVRNILVEGLAQEERLGVNPFRFGMIASTDTHLGAPGSVDESGDYPGHGGAGKPPGDDLPIGLPDDLDFNPGGLVGVWAEENSRGSLFAGMMRRETFGTSGPRIRVRFFGGWDYSSDLCRDPARVSEAYASGVAMGGDLPPSPGGANAAPSFLVSAASDPGTSNRPGTPLQRVQIIKGWLEGSAQHERVYDVAEDPDNGAGVDLDSCEESGAGVGTLCTVWRDPDFDPAQRAFYYARVIENPVCRWSQRFCNANGIQCDESALVPEGFEGCCSPAHQRTIQERAWSSPIWFAPLPDA